MKGTMKAFAYNGPGKWEMESRPIPTPGKGEVLIKVKAASVCGSDMGVYRMTEVNPRWTPPLVLGHEFSGTIAEVGEGVTDLKVGQRVAANPMLYCDDCYYCSKGLHRFCTKRNSLGTSIGGVSTDGAFEEYFKIRAGAIIPLDERVSFEEGALLEPLGVSLKCAKEAFEKGERVCVFGVGPIGLMIVKFLKSLGSGKIMVVDIVEARMQKALEFGADKAVDGRGDIVAAAMEMTDGVGFDRVIVAAEAPNVINNSLNMVRSGGSVVIVALMHHEITLDPLPITALGKSIIGSYMFDDEMEEAMMLLAEKKLSVDGIITSTPSFDEMPKVMETLTGKGNTDIKVVVTMKE